MIFIINYEHKLLRNTTFHGHKSLMLGRPDPSPFLREGCGYARLGEGLGTRLPPADDNYQKANAWQSWGAGVT